MIGFFSGLFARSEPALSRATTSDSATIAALHAASFRRGWSEDELEALLVERNVIAHRAMAGRRLAGFIISRSAADEAEILSVAVAAPWQGRGLGRALLSLHLRSLAGLGIRRIFLEVADGNDPAVRLYRKAGFIETARRDNYYLNENGQRVAALVLARDL
jgi:ribosomal-protein-alanine N-acetyltransferase